MIINPDKNIMSRARDFYAIYCASSEGRNYEGKPVPQWKKLPEAIRGHWYTVALRSIQLQLADPDLEQLGNEISFLPNSNVIDHLGDEIRAENAIGTWTEYSNG